MGKLARLTFAFLVIGAIIWLGLSANAPHAQPAPDKITDADLTRASTELTIVWTALGIVVIVSGFFAWVGRRWLRSRAGAALVAGRKKKAEDDQRVALEAAEERRLKKIEDSLAAVRAEAIAGDELIAETLRQEMDAVQEAFLQALAMDRRERAAGMMMVTDRLAEIGRAMTALGDRQVDMAEHQSDGLRTVHGRLDDVLHALATGQFSRALQRGPGASYAGSERRRHPRTTEES